MKRIFFLAVFLSLTFPRAGFYWDRIPVTLANILLLGVLAIWIIRRVPTGWLRLGLIKRLPKGRLGKMGLVYFGYVVGCAVIGFIQGQIFDTLSGFMAMAGYLGLFFLTKDILKTEKDLRTFYRIIILSLVIVLGYGFMQVFFDIRAISIPGLTELYGPDQDIGDALSKNVMWGLKREDPICFGNKIFSTFHHGNLFGSHLVMLIPIIIATGIFKKANRDKVISILVGITAVIILLFTNSRGALLSFLAGTVVLIFFYKGHRLKISFFSIVIIIGAITILGIILSVALFQGHKICGVDPSLYLCYGFDKRYLGLGEKIFFFSYHKAISGNYAKDSFSTAKEIDGLTNYRLGSLRVALGTIFKERGVRQILFGAFNLARKTITHNYYLGMIFDIGLVGFILFCLLLYCIFSSFISKLSSMAEGQWKAVAIGATAGLIGSLVHNLSDFIFYYPPIMANFWILAGFIISLTKINSSTHPRTSRPGIHSG